MVKVFVLVWRTLAENRATNRNTIISFPPGVEYPSVHALLVDFLPLFPCLFTILFE